MPETLTTQEAEGTPPQEPPSSTPTSTPAAAAEPTSAGTLIEGGTPDGAAPPAGSETDWRTTLAGEDKDTLTALSRYKSSGDFMKSFNEAQATIRSGAHKQAGVLGENPTDEEVATYRKENGIPETAKGYLENLPEGLVFGEADEGILNSFLERSHAANSDPAAVQNVLDWYANELVPQQQEAQQEADTATRAQSIETLREEWGVDYRSNLNSGLNFLKSTAPTLDDGTSSADLILGARLADGSLAGDNPAFIKWLSGIAHEANPAGFIAPGSGLTQEQSVTNEIAEIEGLMKTNPPAYFADNAKQERLRSLYTAREKLAG